MCGLRIEKVSWYVLIKNDVMIPFNHWKPTIPRGHVCMHLQLSSWKFHKVNY